MRFLQLLLFTFSFASIFSQQVLTVSDMPGDNDTAQYSNVSPLSNIDFRNTGPNFLWDFSGISPNSQDYSEYENIFEINLLFVPVFGLNAFGLQTADEINLGPVSFDNIYTYYQKNSNSFKSIGRSLNISGIPAPARNSDDETIFKLPLQYGDTNTDDFELSFPDVGAGILYSVNGTRSYEVDGWGTVITPYDTFECIRVKHTITETNELEVSGVPINITQTREEYEWWSKGVKTPVFEVVANDLPLLGFVSSSIRYMDVYRKCLNESPEINFTASDTIIDKGEVVVFENNTECGTNSKSWNITPDNGVIFINGTNQNSAEPEVFFNTPGLYTVSLTERNNSGTNNLRKEDYIEVRNPTSIETSNSPEFKVFPNPSNGFVQIQSKDLIEQIELFDLSGKLVLSKFNIRLYAEKLDLSQFSEGLYLLRINQESEHKLMVLP